MPSLPLTPAAFQQRAHLNGLDGLRGLAILWVIMHHVMNGTDLGWLNVLHDNGRYGVHLFFVISGFLICTLFLREREATGRISLGKFYGRRVLRLMPLYYAVLIAHVALVLIAKQYTVENQELFARKMPSFLFYYSNWLPTATAGPFFCSWSLAVEEQFYLLFGLLVVLFSTRHLVVAIVAALITKVAFFTMGGVDSTGSTLWRVLFSYQEPILWGVLLAYALNDPAIYARLARWLGRTLVLVGLAAGLVMWFCLHPMISPTSWDAEITYLAMTFLVAGVVMRSWSPLLNAAPLAYIGKISYGIYLLHMIAFSVAKKLPGGTNPWLCLLVTTALSLVLAGITYRWFELPIINWYKRRLSPMRQKQTGGAPVSAPVPAMP